MIVLFAMVVVLGTTGDLVAAVVTDFNYFSFFVKLLQERMFGR
jgi:hypothetical protein